MMHLLDKICLVIFHGKINSTGTSLKLKVVLQQLYYIIVIPNDY